jgi:hypothetical protein
MRAKIADVEDGGKGRGAFEKLRASAVIGLRRS